MRGQVLTAAQPNASSENSNSDRGPATEPYDSQPFRKAAVLRLYDQRFLMITQ